MECRGRGLGLGPGSIVDIGVHMMILDTVAYAEFCKKYNGGDFLHHIPDVAKKTDGSVARTALQIARHGFFVDQPLWDADSSKCTPCRPGEDGHWPHSRPAPVACRRQGPVAHHPSGFRAVGHAATLSPQGCGG